MPRMTLILITLYMLSFVYQKRCFSQHVQDITQIQRTIEKQRQTERIKNKILKELGADSKKYLFKDIDEKNELDSLASGLEQEGNYQILNQQPATPNPMVSLGEPATSKRDRCLVFKIGKYVKNVEPIYPYKIDLWVHLRLRGNRKTKKTKNSTHDHSKGTRSLNGEDLKDKTRKKSKRNEKKGRRIKLFVSDGKKNLVKLRMRIYRTDWYKIELPISYFPSGISAQYSFKLCFKCKRCRKKVKLDLYRKKKVNKNSSKNPKIPFVHFETRSLLPNPEYRYRRSASLRHVERNSTRQTFTCCNENIYEEDFSKSFPNILYPLAAHVSLCTTTSDSNLNQPLLSQHHSQHRNFQCVPKSLDNLNITYLDDDMNVRNKVIPTLLPSGCVCRQIS